LRWGIGKGEEVRIIKDNWIPGYQAGTFNPVSPIPSTAKVYYLMNEADMGWEEDTVRAFFHEQLDEAILHIPISRLGVKDFISWPHDKFGQFYPCTY
jgi:hypothetical protein